MKPWQVFTVLVVSLVVVGLLICDDVRTRRDLSSCRATTPGKPDTVVKVVERIVRDSGRLSMIVRVEKRTDTLWKTVRDTLVVVPVEDSTVRWTLDTTLAGGGFIKVDLSSRELPPRRPLDLKALYNFQLPTRDSVVLVRKVDTLRLHKAVYADWRNYAILGETTLLVYTLVKGLSR